MFQPMLAALAIAAVLFIGYLLLRAYKPRWFQFGKGRAAYAPAPVQELFVPATAPPAAPPQATQINTAMPPVPAAAPSLKEDLPMEEREVSPGGPNPPNARAPRDLEPTISPEAAPIDPYDDKNMEAPVHDSMRHPELSFGPGVENTGMNKLALAGVGSTRAMAGESSFSPEFAQNSGSFMGSVFANDLKKGDFFAEV